MKEAFCRLIERHILPNIILIILLSAMLDFIQTITR
jgi:ABC-type dipeptide/oligopeptide/nickel transport system permease subunit